MQSENKKHYLLTYKTKKLQWLKCKSRMFILCVKSVSVLKTVNYYYTITLKFIVLSNQISSIQCCKPKNETKQKLSLKKLKSEQFFPEKQTKKSLQIIEEL